MKKPNFALLLLIILRLPAISQSKLQLALTAGPTFTSSIAYRNCTGHIGNAATASVALIYRPVDKFGMDFKFSLFSHPRSYLNISDDNTLKAYTESHIVFQRLMAGLNYYLSSKKIQPFVSLIAGASYAQTTEISPETSIINFNWGLQTGATVKISRSFAIRVDACEIFIPGVSNNSSYFNAGGNGSGFPSFIIGEPSKATIQQWNINLGLQIDLNKRNK